MSASSISETPAFRYVPKSSPSYWKAFALGERLAAGAALTAVAPVIATCALATRLLSRRSPFVAHLRVGNAGRPLWVLKLRTMWDESTSAGHGLKLVEYVTDNAVPPIKSSQDTRVTSRFARFCRRYSLDELPQLLHVFRGEMSFVGPRPLTASELATYYGPDAAEVLQVTPGISGLWQVLGRSMLSYTQRLRLDLFFVRRRTIGLYFWILLRTLPVVLSGRGAV